MDRRRHETGGRTTARVAVIWLAAALAACEPWWNTPEGRARDFIEALVLSPAQTESLRDIANLAPDQNPEGLLDNLAARIGLDFLRARRAQGVTLKFAPGETRKTGAARRAVMIHVRYLEPGTPATGEVRFLVRVEKNGQGRWRIASVAGDN
jgi:hypothetical protein